MVFVYFLAVVGLFALVGFAALGVLMAVKPIESDESAGPYDEALSAVARMQAGAWHAVQELRQLEGEGGRGR